MCACTLPLGTTASGAVASNYQGAKLPSRPYMGRFPEAHSMIGRIHLRNFKNFRQADLQLGPFTLLIGMNASGKSNLRDAFRFLHGVGRGIAWPRSSVRSTGKVGYCSGVAFVGGHGKLLLLGRSALG